MKKAISIVEFLLIIVVLVVLYFLQVSGKIDVTSIFDFKKSNNAIEQKKNVDVELGKIQKIRNMQDDNYKRIQESY